MSLGHVLISLAFFWLAFFAGAGAALIQWRYGLPDWQTWVLYAVTAIVLLSLMVHAYVSEWPTTPGAGDEG